MIDKPRIAVLGASGMLGSMLVEYLSQFYQVVAMARTLPPSNNGWRYFDTDSPMDFADCDYIINAIGAIPQKKPSIYTYSVVNVLFPLRLSQYAKQHGIKVIQIATDCVYSGETGNYTEDMPHDDTTQYGLSKSLGEASNFINLRCSIIGHGPHDDYSLLGWFLNQPKGAEVSGYTNHQWNGLTTLHFAKICQAVIESRKTWEWLHPVQHIVPKGSASKYELLCYFRECFRPDITVMPVSPDKAVDRTLATIYPEVNRQLWQAAGYLNPPSIVCMEKEYAEWRSK